MLVVRYRSVSFWAALAAPAVLIVLAVAIFSPSASVATAQSEPQDVGKTAPFDTPTPTITLTPTPNCGTGSNYIVQSSTGGFVAGSVDIGNHCDDCTTAITLPFTYIFYGQPFTQANVSSNGVLQFSSAITTATNICLPDATFNNAIFAHWDDLTTMMGAGRGVFTSITGTTPNRIFNIEWRTCRSDGTGSCPPGPNHIATFEARLYEGQNRFDLAYSTSGNSGNEATAGVQKGTGAQSTQFSCNTTSLTDNLLLIFTQPACPTLTPTSTPTNTPTPVPTCGSGSNYVIAASPGASVVPGTTSIGNNCDECTTTISLPFAYNLYGQPFSTAIVGSNGTLGFTANGNGYNNYCLPRTSFSNAIFVNWDDLRTDITGTVPSGIFTSVSGVAPNRIFNIEWRAVRFSTGADVNFEARLYEGQSRFDIIFGGNLDNSGSSATVGVQRGTGPQQTQYACNTANSLQPGLQLSFTQPACPTSTPTFTSTASATRTNTFTNTPTGTATNTNTHTRTPTASPTACGNYSVTQFTGATIVPGTTDIGNHTDDGITTVALPFPYSFYSQPFNSVNVGSNGNLQFTSNNTFYGNACLPVGTVNGSPWYDVIMPHWDDLLTNAVGDGIFVSTSGAAPNRIFNIEWRACLFSAGVCGGDVNFEVRLYEAQGNFEFIYGTVTNGGGSATVGVQQETGSLLFTQFECNTVGSLAPGLRLAFAQSPCFSPTPVPTSTSTNTSTNTRTNTPTFTPCAACTLTPTITRTSTTTNTRTSTSTFTFTPTQTSTSTPTFTRTPTSTPTGTPTSTPACGTDFKYLFSQSLGGFIDSSGKTRVSPDNCDDCSLHLVPPFPYLFYGQSYNVIDVSENGNVRFPSSTATATGTPTSVPDTRPSCLADSSLDDAILAYWQDLDASRSICAGCGIFTATTGTAPSRIFLIEWRANPVDSVGSSSSVNFELRLYEGQSKFDIVYGAVESDGANASVGVHGSSDAQFSSFSCDNPGLVPGLQVNFILQACPMSIGHVTWQGRLPQPDARQALPITLTLKMGGTEINYPGQSTDASGFFTVPVGGLAPGIYDWRVKGPKFLANAGTVNLTGSSVTSVEMGVMKAGDADNNNVVSAVDFNILRGTFGKTLGDPGYDDRADFDGNLVINTTDFNLIRGNFGLGGAPPIMPGGSEAGIQQTTSLRL